MTTEEAGRKVRYDSFVKVAKTLVEEGVKPDKIKIVVAHNLNDQAETLLFRLIRGTGTDGLAGMDYMRRDRSGFIIIRPLLDVKREEIEEYCEKNELKPRMDETNEQPIYARNKIRLELIPYLRDNFNSNITDSVNRLCIIARDDSNYIRNQADKAWEEVFIGNKNGVCVLKRDFVKKEDAAIRHRLILRGFEEVGLIRDITFAHLNQADKLIDGRNASGHIDMNPEIIQDTGDVISEVMGKLFYSNDEDLENSLINNAIFHLLNFEKYSSFPDAAKAAALNNDFQLIILSEDFNPVLSVETRHRTTIAEAIRLGKEREVEKQSSVYTMIDVNGVLTYWGPVTIQGSKYFMFIVDNEDSFSGSEINKLAEIIELAMGMWKYTPERDVRSEFIKALRRGNMSLAYSLKDEAGIDPDSIVSVFYAKEIEKGLGKKIMEEFEHEITGQESSS